MADVAAGMDAGSDDGLGLRQLDAETPARPELLAAARFRHGVIFYGDGDRGFLAETLPLVRRALERDAPAMIAVGPERATAMRDALGEDAARVSFLDMHAVGRNPARIIPVWREFVDEHCWEGPALGIGEPVWPGRNRHELSECQRHESLLNVAFDGGPGWELVCPYDLDGLDDDVIEAAHGSHPFPRAALIAPAHRWRIPRSAPRHRSSPGAPRCGCWRY